MLILLLMLWVCAVDGKLMQRKAERLRGLRLEQHRRPVDDDLIDHRIEQPLELLREKVPRNWADLCDSVTDNFRVINPKEFRVMGEPSISQKKNVRLFELWLLQKPLSEEFRRSALFRVVSLRQSYSDRMNHSVDVVSSDQPLCLKHVH